MRCRTCCSLRGLTVTSKNADMSMFSTLAGMYNICTKGHSFPLEQKGSQIWPHSRADRLAAVRFFLCYSPLFFFHFVLPIMICARNIFLGIIPFCLHTQYNVDMQKRGKRWGEEGRKTKQGSWISCSRVPWFGPLLVLLGTLRFFFLVYHLGAVQRPSQLWQNTTLDWMKPSSQTVIR